MIFILCSVAVTQQSLDVMRLYELYFAGEEQQEEAGELGDLSTFRFLS